MSLRRDSEDKIMAGSSFGPPDIADSTENERREYVKARYHCINDCDMCGICASFHNVDPQIVFREYIRGEREFLDIARAWK